MSGAAPPSHVTVDLGAVVDNFRTVRAIAGRPVIAVVKADAYGHGARDVASALAVEPGCAGFAVARPDEALALRAGLERSRILVLSCGALGLGEPELDETLAALRRARVVPVMGSLDELRRVEERTPGTTRWGVHLKVDTGMSRSGIGVDELPAALDLVRSSCRISLRGLLSHLAESERPTSPATAAQLEAFELALGLLRPRERRRIAVHLANSAAALHLPASRQRLVRVGGALYGIDLAAAGKGSPVRPTMTVRSTLVQVRSIAAGTAVGYGGRWVAERASRIGLVPVGYGDGFPAAVSRSAHVLVAGGRAPVIGAVSMDFITVDLTDIGGSPGDPVVLLGELGGRWIDVFDHAAWSASPAYEVTCRFSRRLPRLVLRSGAGS